MRILLINSEYPPIGGGAGSASAHLADRLNTLGQEITVLTARYGNLPPEAVQNDVRVKRIKTLRRKQDRSNAFEQMIFLLTGSYHALSLIRHWRPDVILAFFGIPSGAVSWVVKKFTGIPYLVSLRGGDVPGFRPYDFAFYHRLASPFLNGIWHCAGAVVANSQGLRQLAANFNNQIAIQVIPNGVDIHQFSLPEKRDWKPPKMLFVGRLVYQKGLDLLVNALGELRELPWHLTLVGDGPHRYELEALAKGFGFADRIEFKGWIHKDVITQEYSEANLFVFPSRHEGMPNAVLEAMASGLPVVASNIAGNEELIIHGKTGLLVPPENPQVLRDELRKILPDSEGRMKMGLESRKRVENNFTWERVADQYLTLLQGIIG
jgi:glycosyltransferase involved in cell wall biosynthesis